MTEIKSGNAFEALLWSLPSASFPEPPIETKPHVLPIGQLRWDDAERLFLRILHTSVPVQYAKLFGTPGQDQAGIDAYGRLPIDLVRNDTTGRHYVVLQSRRVKQLSAQKIKEAVDDFLDGDWSATASRFYYATSFDLQDAKLDSELRLQTERLAEIGIEFIPWGIQEVSPLLRDLPRLVDDFFGRRWVELFCSAEAAQALSQERPLSHDEAQRLRSELRILYTAVFSSQGGAMPAARADTRDPFVVLDVVPHRQQVEGVELEMHEDEADVSRAPATTRPEGPEPISVTRVRRPSLRSASDLVSRHEQTPVGGAGGTAADQWLSTGRLRVLVGAPGSGKSSLLQFAAVDLLASAPQSVPLQREHAADLPIWLPFGFLCRHIEASNENSLVSAVAGWLKHQSAGDLWPLVAKALEDRRLLLLVDGIDEWGRIAEAERALGLLEAFVARTQTSAVLSTRPYALDRLNWTQPWARAQVAPLDDWQRRSIASSVLQRVEDSLPTQSGVVPGSGLDIFLDQLAATPELSDLSRSPLFLTLLATVWRGEPLPRQRFKIYDRLVELLVEKHPQLRRRASQAHDPSLTPTEATALFSAVAYRLRTQDATASASRTEMKKLIIESLVDNDILGYELPHARRVADNVLALAEQEFGLIVSHGAGAVGFLHRAVLDHLAGRHLATRIESEQVQAVKQYIHDPAWRDVLLSLLAAQVSPHTSASLLNAALGGHTQPWDDIDGYELLAEALAAGVKVTPTVQAAFFKTLIDRVENHPLLRHRANLITALCSSLATHATQALLLPTFKRWMTAPRPDPSPTVWALRDTPIGDDRAAAHLLRGLRHPLDVVKLNAAEALAHRFGGRAELAENLVELIHNGPSADSQAAALRALGRGWPAEPETVRLTEWARRQSAEALRCEALRIVQRDRGPKGDADLFRPEERAWLLSLLHDEDHLRGPWDAAKLINIAAAGASDVADFALETLTTNGGNDGDRQLAWFLACNAFADDDRFKQWVASELSGPDRQGLILYNTQMIPQQWRDDPVFMATVRPAINVGADGILWSQFLDLASALEPPEYRAFLLQALDSPRPYFAARTLVEQFPQDDEVHTILIDRLMGSFATSAPFAQVAIAVQGPEEGFSTLASLLSQFGTDNATESEVVVALAIAEAWVKFRHDATQPGPLQAPAQRVLAGYDPQTLAKACVTVDDNFFFWHAPDVIAAWPEQQVVQTWAERMLYDPGLITAGINDAIPGTVLRVYSARSDEASRRLVNKTLDLLEALPPELREVAAFELARAPVAASDLVDVLSNWKSDPDGDVRRIALVGAIRAISRQQQALEPFASPAAVTPEMQWLRNEIRDQLCAYGPELDERRQLAWIGMLLLGDLTLIDGIEERNPPPAKPGVALTIFGSNHVDHLLVSLIAANWPALEAHFGDELLDRFKGKFPSGHRDSAAQRRHVMASLASVASEVPSVVEMLRREAAADSYLMKTANFLLWAKDENRGDEASLRALIETLDNKHDECEPDRVMSSLLAPDSWNVTEQFFKTTLVGDATASRPSPFARSPARRIVFAQAFPHDDHSIEMLDDLETWFREGRPAYQRYEWDEALAIAFGVSRTEDLPAIASRVHNRLRSGSRMRILPSFTRALVRRLLTDTDTVGSFHDAMRHPLEISERSPLFADPSPGAIAARQPDHVSLERTYLFARALQHTAALRAQDGAEAVEFLMQNTMRTVVHDPFTGYEGPLHIATLEFMQS